MLSLRLTLQGSGLPESEDSYIISAKGSGAMEPAAFEGTFTAKIRGVQADMPTVAVDGGLWIKLPFAPGYVEIDPQSFNVPDPAGLLDEDTGLVSLLGQTAQPEFGKRARDGAEVVQEITGTLPGTAIRRVLAIGDEDAAFDVTYGLVEESWQLRTVTMDGEFYPPTRSTYALTFDAYGEPVTIERP